MPFNPKIKKSLSLSNVIYGIIILLLISVTFNANAKALMIEGLMKIGFFQPKIEFNDITSNSDTNNIPESSRELYFKDGNGNTFNLSSLKGKVVFINFWATWCPPCRAELHSINKLYEKFKDNNQIAFLMVDVDGKYKSSERFMKRHHFDLPVYIVEGEIPPAFLGDAIPTTVILNKDGAIVVRHTGAADYNTRAVEKGLTQLINN